MGAFMFIGYGMLAILAHVDNLKSASPATIDAPSFDHGKDGPVSAPTAYCRFPHADQRPS